MKMGDFDIILRMPFMLVTFLFVLAVFLGILVWTCLKGDSNTMRKLPIIFAAVHFVLIVIFSIVILVWTRYDEEAGVAWIVFSPLEWPLSFMAESIFKNEWNWGILKSIFQLPIIRIIPDAIKANVLFPFIEFGIFGTAQYYIWGLIISKILLFLKK